MSCMYIYVGTKCQLLLLKGYALTGIEVALGLFAAHSPLKAWSSEGKKVLMLEIMCNFDCIPGFKTTLEQSSWENESHRILASEGTSSHLLSHSSSKNLIRAIVCQAFFWVLGIQDKNRSVLVLEEPTVEPEAWDLEAERPELQSSFRHLVVL